MQNSAGAWMTPGFQLHLSKLDIEDPKSFERAQTGASTLGIRRPKILASSPAAAAATGPTAAASVSTHGAVPASDSHAPFPTTSMHFDGFTHLILDCDGVMVDSERPSCESLRRAILAATGFDIPHSFPEDFQPVFGMDVRSCVEYYRLRFNKTGEWGEDDATLAAKVSDTKEGIYREMTQGGVQAFEGVRELVQSARALGMGVAVASSGSPEKIAHNLGSSGLGDLVPQELIVSAKYVARGKPAPDVYLEALRRLGCEDASRAVVVEDAVNGLAAAREAGCFTVGVATSLPVEALQGHADVVVEELKNIDLKALQRPKLGTV